ncbi:uncharacterized protein LOC116844657 [Odontomachus brunneus]|uniref:uncharacterized protein LOC116844657 n=1 Tax=Odontomachus brunneus TaxID=486640 RepID=UPI0013F1A031|nr:uncharacterized protein LOC116844657 [Odontomachus brunneus]XP_032672388.1 uncharacterized protein LOC116844657 [Odontomachus brunneus]
MLKHGLTTSQIGKKGFPRQHMQKSTVFHLVYRYLNEVADRDLRWRQRNNAYNRFRRQHARRKNIRTQASTLTRMNYDAGIGDVCARPDQKRLPEMLRTLRSSSEECIADYARAVQDERKRAKSYIRHALLYGLRSGLLIPTNRQRTLHVSEKLGIFSTKDSTGYEEDQSSTSSSDT